MRKNHFAVGECAFRAREHEIHRRFRRFLRIIKDRLWEGTVDEMGINRMCRVYEHDCVSSIQSFPDGFEVRMAQIMIIVAVTGEQCYAVGFECVESIFDFV